MKNLSLFLFSCFLLLFFVGCDEIKTFSGKSIREIAGKDQIKVMPPKAFFIERMKNNNLSKNLKTKLFKIIHETDDYVYAGYISLGDLQAKRDRYCKISKYDKRKLVKEFPLYKTFMSRDAWKIINQEHAKYDPFVVNCYQHLNRRNQAHVADYDDSNMVYTLSYEYSGNHGPWQNFKMIVKINKTYVADIRSEQIQ